MSYAANVKGTNTVIVELAQMMPYDIRCDRQMVGKALWSVWNESAVGMCSCKAGAGSTSAFGVATKSIQLQCGLHSTVKNASNVTRKSRQCRLML